MLTAMRFAVLSASGLAWLAACGSSDLQSIREAGSDEAGSSDPAGMPDAGAMSDAAAMSDTGGVVTTDGGAPPDSGPTSDGGTPRCKRGIAANAPPSAALAPGAAGPGVTWWYNWSTKGTSGSPAIEFEPMIWGSAALSGPIAAGSKYLMGFNEPNFKAQSNLTPQQAAADWPEVEALAQAGNVPLVSPAVNYCGSPTNSSQCSDPSVTDPYTYLKDFFAACTGCRVDYVAVHWYNCDLPSLKGYLEGNGGGLQGFVQFGKPIWLTEFSCDGSHSVADQEAYMKAAVPYLETNPHVYRYSWFSASPIPNAVLMNGDGSLTALGKTYVSLPASCP